MIQKNEEKVNYKNQTSLVGVLESTMDKYPDLMAITDTYNNISLTYREFKEEIRSFATGLQSLGVKKGDKVGLFSENNGRWMSTSLSILKCGAIDVVRGSNAPIDELEYIAMHSDAKGLILRDVTLFKGMREFLTKYKFDFIILMFKKSEIDTTDVKSPVYSFDEIVEKGKNLEFTPVDIQRDDDLTILYTSGTTGLPKGVLLSQNNMIYQLEVVHEGFLAMPGENTLQILPVWHAYERIGQCYYVSRACHLHFTTLSGLKNDLMRYEIHTMMSVPRIWESIRGGIYQKLKQTSGFAYNLFDFAIKTSIKYKAHKMYGERRITNKLSYNAFSTVRHRIARSFYKPLHALFTNTLYKKLKKATGLDKFRATISGGGALSMQDELFYDAIGINLRIGYGLTETSPVLTLRNIYDKNFLGSAGSPLPGTEIKIVDPKTMKEMPKYKKGLVMARGPQIMKGYYKDEKATKAVVDDEGWFNTGDLGWLTNENNLVLVGRLKETIVLSSGENVEPIPIEEACLTSPYIEQMVLVGQDRSGIGALIVPSKEALEKCGITLKDVTSYKDSINNEVLQQLIKQELNERIINKPNLKIFERIKQFKILKDSFSVENGLMSASMKIKRNKVFERYEKEISEMYK